MVPLIDYPVPSWVSIFFLIAIPLPFILILDLVRKGAKETHQPFVFASVFAFYVLYLFYIGFASFMGWFNKAYFPPKVILYTTIPYALLLFFVVANIEGFKKIFQIVSLQSLVKLHIFRMIGVFFILFAFYNVLPKTFALIAGIGDIVIAITSIYVAKAIETHKKFAKTLTIAWNIFGAIDILFTAIAANVLTKFSIDTGVMGVDTLAKFPFCIIPAFAPPTILFLHWLISKKLKTFIL